MGKPIYDLQLLLKSGVFGGMGQVVFVTGECISIPNGAVTISSISLDAYGFC